MMFRMLTFFILLLAAFAAFAQETADFRAGVSLVKVDVQVSEGGIPVIGLGRGDFVILDEGLPRQPVYFARESEPLWLLLLLDVSGSTRKYVKEMGNAAQDALKALHPGDRIGIMVFGRNSEMRRDFSSQFGAISQSILASVNARDLGSGTRINDAVIAAARQIQERAGDQPGRRAILILTDNKGLNYQVPDEAVLKALHGADTVLNGIAVGNAKPPGPLQEGANPDFTPPDVFLLARETGGEVVRAKQAGRAFEKILERIRTRYSLHYEPPQGEPGSFRRIQVELSPATRKEHPTATIQARAGYYIPD